MLTINKCCDEKLLAHTYFIGNKACTCAGFSTRYGMKSID